ncbi:MAG: OmpH family outer membrane protein [Planctomycetota bacterium]
MKTILFRATIVAIPLVCCVISGQVSAQEGQPRPSGTSVAVIDLGEVFKSHPRLASEIEDIKSELNSFQTMIRQEQQKGQSLSEELKTLKPGTQGYTVKEKELANLETDLNVMVRQRKREMLEKEAQIRYRAYQEIQQHVARFCQKYGIQLVIRFDRNPIDSSNAQQVLAGLNRPIIYQNSLDITDHIIDALEADGPVQNTANRNQVPPRPGK